MSERKRAAYAELEASGLLNRVLFKFTGILGLTTGIGVIAWGVWSLLVAIATFAYEESEGGTRLSVEEILVNSAFNESLLLCALVVGVGVIILELKKVQDLLLASMGRGPDDEPG